VTPGQDSGNPGGQPPGAASSSAIPAGRSGSSGPASPAGAATATVEAPPSAPKGRTSYSLAARDRRFGYGLVAPAVIVLLAITGFPLVYNIWISFHQGNNLFPTTFYKFVGVDNYKAMFSGGLFLPSLYRTLGFTVVSVAIEFVIGLALALALNRAFRGRGIVRAAILIPWAVPTVVSGFLWKSMFDPQNGFVNYILTHLHLPLASTTWLTQTWTAWAAILVADAWRNVPFMALLLLAGLQIIPRDVYEAAKIDGAGVIRTFSRITLPMLKPAIMVALIFRTLSSFLIFDVVYAMSRGGPGNSTQVLAYLNWFSLIPQSDVGLGAAISVALMVMSLIIAAIYVGAFRTEQVV
jgi:ABC-type sugar transport system permease subunit